MGRAAAQADQGPSPIPRHTKGESSGSPKRGVGSGRIRPYRLRKTPLAPRHNGRVSRKLSLLVRTGPVCPQVHAQNLNSAAILMTKIRSSGNGRGLYASSRMGDGRGNIIQSGKYISAEEICDERDTISSAEVVLTTRSSACCNSLSVIWHWPR